MPDYFVHVRSGWRQYRDQRGRNLKDRASVEAYVIKMIQQIVQDHPPEGNEHEFGVIVQDAANRGIYRAKLDFISEWADEPQEKVVIQ